MGSLYYYGTSVLQVEWYVINHFAKKKKKRKRNLIIFMEVASLTWQPYRSYLDPTTGLCKLQKFCKFLQYIYKRVFYTSTSFSTLYQLTVWAENLDII